MKFSLAEHALHPQHQPVVKQAGVVDAVGVGDQRVTRPGQIQQPVPGGVVAGQPGDLQRQDDPDLAHRQVRDQRLEPGALPEHRPRNAQVDVYDPDLLRRPSQGDRPLAQVVLAGGGLGVAFQLGKC
jgi:hypothetical protein